MTRNLSFKKSPIIGITTYSRSEAGEFTLPGAYVDAVQLAGGIPILLPPNQPDPAQILDVVDGLIFSGGGDINPDLYSGTYHHTTYLVDEERDEFEFALATLALTQPIPVLGICRGMQVISVVSGTKLIPHVPEVYGNAIAHRLEHPRRPTEHPVQIQPGSKLAEILQETHIDVVSWHHQAIQAVPVEWQPVAWASDGLVEALEHKSHPWMITVQWHPELSPTDSVHQRLFEALIDAAAC